MADGDNLSICTTDTDEYHYVARRPDKPHLDNLLVEVFSFHRSLHNVDLHFFNNTIHYEYINISMIIKIIFSFYKNALV